MITSDNNGMFMPVAPAYMSGNGNCSSWGNDWGEWIILFLIFGMFGNNGFGGWGGNGNGGFNTMYPWLNNSNQINDGFRDQMLNSNISSIQNGITSGFGDVQNSLCGGFAGVNASINAAQNAIATQMYANQIADLERSFNAQTANTQGIMGLQSQLAQCCCDNRAATQDLKYVIATENCSDRQVVNDGVRELLAAQTASTQKILDQMCQDKIDAKNDEIARLRQEVSMKDLAASQTIQTQMIEQYVRPNPSPAYIVANPYCNYNNYGCGCGA